MPVESLDSIPPIPPLDSIPQLPEEDENFPETLRVPSPDVFGTQGGPLPVGSVGSGEGCGNTFLEIVAEENDALISEMLWNMTLAEPYPMSQQVPFEGNPSRMEHTQLPETSNSVAADPVGASCVNGTDDDLKAIGNVYSLYIDIYLYLIYI